VGAKFLKMSWPELGKEVLVEPLKVNKELFDWFLENVPCKSVQGHAVVSGELTYTKDIPICKPMTFKYRKLESMLLTEAPLGTVFINVSRGRAGVIMIKYGAITENMSYPVLGQVRKKDLGIAKEVGAMVWDAIYNTKKIITCRFEEV
jgi:hypothetical protein